MYRVVDTRFLGLTAKIIFALFFTLVFCFFVLFFFIKFFSTAKIGL